MPNILKSPSSEQETPARSTDLPAASRAGAPQGWVRMGAIAAASAVLGGLAAAWFYRKTISQLREAENNPPEFLPNITENETEEDF